MPVHEVCLHIGVLEALPQSGVQRRKVVGFIQSLRGHPGATGDYTDKDASLRERQIKIVGNFAVTYWLDAPARTVMVVDVRKADG